MTLLTITWHVVVHDMMLSTKWGHGGSVCGPPPLPCSQGSSLCLSLCAAAVSVNGQPYSKATRKRIGFVLQDDVLYESLTVKVGPLATSSGCHRLLLNSAACHT